MSTLSELLDTIPVNIERMIRSHDIILNKNASQSEIKNGVNRSNIGEIRKTGDEYHILVLGLDHYYRKRFTMAHELAHFLLHKEKIDRLGSIADSAEYEAEGITPEEEKEANSFAAEILMPENKVKEIFVETSRNQNGNEENTAVEMSKMFQVTLVAIKYRLYQLDLIKNFRLN